VISLTPPAVGGVLGQPTGAGVAGEILDYTLLNVANAHNAKQA